ncbi:hypothetical protein PHPALM_28694 [Phytophthora palmivora]|uniref:Uncharacterized protein n=1 Tax=Phytophthora palmivora TaxID=4796 RepID=A0A2P4X9E6_9STRA|nr:hypothetical protein PHPALM_28694 [Phytophthora palmivora]
MSKFSPQLSCNRSRPANLMLIHRFLNRNRSTIRRITHKGRKPVTTGRIKEERILAYEGRSSKYAVVYNMDQTAIYIDMNGRITMILFGAPTIDVLQGSAVNGFRATVILAASATGHKFIPVVVFAGVSGARVAAEV